MQVAVVDCRDDVSVLRAAPGGYCHYTALQVADAVHGMTPTQESSLQTFAAASVFNGFKRHCMQRLRSPVACIVQRSECQ
jgi:hypothetical protein